MQKLSNKTILKKFKEILRGKIKRAENICKEYEAEKQYRHHSLCSMKLDALKEILDDLEYFQTTEFPNWVNQDPAH